MKIIFKLMMVAMMAATLLAMTGCFRKHIESSPPTRRPATTPATAEPAPKPAAVEEKAEIIEETYVVGAPEEDTAPQAPVNEGDLDDEPVAAPATSETAVDDSGKEEAAATTAAIAEPAPEAKAEAEPEKAMDESTAVETVALPATGMYYVQIGAFGDLENANRALARLLSDGYNGSRLSKTDDGLYRVQAGAFPDETSAAEALAKLLDDYPKGFVMKGSPQE